MKETISPQSDFHPSKTWALIPHTLHSTYTLLSKFIHCSATHIITVSSRDKSKIVNPIKLQTMIFASWYKVCNILSNQPRCFSIRGSHGLCLRNPATLTPIISIITFKKTTSRALTRGYNITIHHLSPSSLLRTRLWRLRGPRATFTSSVMTFICNAVVVHCARSYIDSRYKERNQQWTRRISNSSLHFSLW